MFYVCLMDQHPEPPHPAPKHSAPPVTSVDVILMCLSIFVLGSMTVQMVFDLPEELHRLLSMFDNIICMAFLANFCFKIISSKDRLGYLKWGWIDLLASIPNVDALRVGRAVSVLRLFMVLRAFRSFRMLWSVLFRAPARGIMAVTLLLTITVIITASILILQVETAEKSNIRAAYDALWWSITTVTTVGYGDHYPVTVGGRVIAVALMGVGIALYATFTAFISSWVIELGKKHDEPSDLELIHAELSKIREELEKLRRNVDPKF